MTLEDFPDVARLDDKQRLELADLLYESVDADDTPVPGWQLNILKERLEEFRRGEVQTVPLEEAVERIRKTL